MNNGDRALAIGALVISFLALGVVYSYSQAPVAQLAQAQGVISQALQAQLNSCRQTMDGVNEGVNAKLSDAARLLDNLVYAIENQDNAERDPAKPEIGEAMNQAREWFGKR